MAQYTLVEIENAIKAHLTGGESYSRLSFALKRTPLDQLRALRKELLQETNRAAGNDVFVPDFSGGGASTESSEWGD